jgi:hypothetical protein
MNPAESGSLKTNQHACPKREGHSAETGENDLPSLRVHGR